MRYITLLLLFSLSYHSQAQNGFIDSLQAELRSSKPDSIAVSIYQQLAWNLKYSEPKKAFLFLDTALHLAENQGPKTQANVLYYKAIIFYLTDDFENAIPVAEVSLSKYESANYAYGQASIYNLLGLINNRIGAYEEAIKSYHESLKFAEQGENLYATSNPLHNIALIYLDTRDYSQSLDYALKALEIRNEIGDSIYIAQSFQTIGGIYHHLEKFDSAKFYLSRSEPIFRAANDLNSLGINLSNLGQVYVSEGRTQEAKSLFREAIQIADQLDAKEDKVNALVNLSIAYQTQSNYDSALIAAKRAYKAAKENDLLPSVRESLEQLVIAYEGKGDFENAFRYSSEMMVVSDSLLNNEKVEQISNLEIRFQVAQKEQQLAVQQAEIERQDSINQRNTSMLAGAGGVILLLIGLGIQGRSRLKWKNRQEMEVAKRKAREAEVTAVISSQEKERNRFARDLHDGFGQLISTLNLHLKNLEGIKMQGEREKVFAASSGILDEMYKELKNVCFDLMPQTLIKHGLEAAIQELANRINISSDGFIEVNIFGLDSRLVDLQEIAVYRITQEWINNVIKYSDAKKITVQITKDDKECTLLIEDDGRGFDKNLLAQGTGNGWKNISSRSNLINGQIEFESNPDQRGNCLIINFEPKLNNSQEEELVKKEI